MTERLSQLLHEEAGHLAPPVPDPARLAGEGRRLRRRRHVVTGAAVAASVVVIATGAAVLAVLGRGDPEPEPVDVDRDAIVWGYDGEVHLGAATGEVPGTVLSLHHTSVGVLAVSTTADGPLAAPMRLSLVRYDGSTEDLGELEPGIQVVTDPNRDDYVLVEPRGSERVVVVRDARTGDVRDELDLPEVGASRPWVTRDGDRLYVRLRPRRIVTVDLTTGEVRPAPAAAVDSGEATRDRAVTGDRRTFRVVDVTTGEELMRFPTGPDLVAAQLSPGADYLRVVRDREGARLGSGEPRRLQVYEVDSGDRIRVDVGDADAADGGWTLSGDVYAFSGTGVVRCELPSGRCSERTLDALPEQSDPPLVDPPLAQVVLPDRP